MNIFKTVIDLAPAFAGTTAGTFYNANYFHRQSYAGR